MVFQCGDGQATLYCTKGKAYKQINELSENLFMKFIKNNKM